MSSTPIPLGKLAEDGAGRDAIHIAVAPVVAAEVLSPGEHIGIDPDGLATPKAKPIGIVDPYLMRAVKPGERFYLCLYPNTIQSLRHHWVHPAFKDEAPAELQKVEDDLVKEDARKRIASYAEAVGLSYEALMAAAKNWIDFNDYYTFGHDLDTIHYGTDIEEFWKNYEIVTGTKVEEKGSFFSCAC